LIYRYPQEQLIKGNKAMMKGGLAGLMKQAQQMQEKMKVAQEQLAALEVTGQAAGGLVKVTISGKHEMKRVQIDPGAMDDREMLEDLLVTAYTEAFKQVEAASSQVMSGATAGMPMPPGFKLPF
jgi:DNA-binding YbaB/EbfC family protein